MIFYIILFNIFVAINATIFRKTSNNEKVSNFDRKTSNFDIKTTNSRNDRMFGSSRDEYGWNNENKVQNNRVGSTVDDVEREKWVKTSTITLEDGTTHTVRAVGIGAVADASGTSSGGRVVYIVEGEDGRQRVVSSGGGSISVDSETGVEATGVRVSETWTNRSDDGTINRTSASVGNGLSGGDVEYSSQIVKDEDGEYTYITDVDGAKRQRYNIRDADFEDISDSETDFYSLRQTGGDATFTGDIASSSGRSGFVRIHTDGNINVIDGDVVNLESDDRIHVSISGGKDINANNIVGGTSTGGSVVGRIRTENDMNVDSVMNVAGQDIRSWMSVSAGNDINAEDDLIFIGGVDHNHNININAGGNINADDGLRVIGSDHSTSIRMTAGEDFNTRNNLADYDVMGGKHALHVNAGNDLNVEGTEVLNYISDDALHVSSINVGKDLNLGENGEDIVYLGGDGQKNFLRMKVGGDVTAEGDLSDFYDTSSTSENLHMVGNFQIGGDVSVGDDFLDIDSADSTAVFRANIGGDLNSRQILNYDKDDRKSWTNINIDGDYVSSSSTNNVEISGNDVWDFANIRVGGTINAEGPSINVDTTGDSHAKINMNVGGGRFFPLFSREEQKPGI
eukprot:GHVL01012104.1.p1 GENE.GHVL01012104.1~~GHVL01012104.1.p1  ORF type:complete len:633 (+),score=152.10 GHVL01012104.1:30-1901(+)